MKQKTANIYLRDFMDRDDGWGHSEGQEVFNRLIEYIEQQPDVLIFRISLDGIKRTDASFPRESIVKLAKELCRKKGFCLTSFNNQDLIDNWDAAALKKNQPLMVWDSFDKWRIIGPNPSRGNKEIFEYIVSFDSITASAAAKFLNLKIANTSMKLKQLEKEGFLLRSEEVSPSGGKEYIYYPIK